MPNSSAYPGWIPQSGGYDTLPGALCVLLDHFQGLSGLRTNEYGRAGPLVCRNNPEEIIRHRSLLRDLSSVWISLCASNLEAQQERSEGCLVEDPDHTKRGSSSYLSGVCRQATTCSLPLIVDRLLYIHCFCLWTDCYIFIAAVCGQTATYLLLLFVEKLLHTHYFCL